MKELSIEEKAKRYDDALKVLHKYDGANIMFTQDLKEEMFPELAESDESIKKWLIDYLNNRVLNLSSGSEKEAVIKAISWIEKQAEQNTQGKSALETAKEEKVDNQNCVKSNDNIKPKFKVGDVIEVKPMKCHDKIFIGKHNKIIDIKEKSYILDDGKTYSIELQDGWKLSEQKPTDKVEPKFKVGDWVVFNNKHQSIYQVEKIEDEYYILRHTHGGTFRVCVLHDESLRLWTILDAKDGDVLYTSSTASHETFIFENIDEKGNAKCYFAYDSEDGFREGKYHFIGRATDCKPATKEQRDILFKKMKEAGYEWDADKKELKKIVVPIFSIGDTIAKKHNSDIHDFGSFTITDITGGKYWYNDRIICDITEQDKFEIYEPIRQNSVKLSEEDEKEVAILKGYIYSRNWSDRHIDRALSIVDELVNKVKSSNLI